VARYGSAWVSGLALLLIAGIGGCEVRGVPFTGGAGRTAGPVTVYVANEGDGTVTPIRAASHAAGRPSRIGHAPALIAISPDGQTAYVVGVGSLLPDAAAPVTLTSIRTATDRPERVITVCVREKMGGVIAPDAIAITPDSRTVYLSCLATGQVVPVRAGADTASAPFQVSSPGALAVAAGGRTVYVANFDGDTITPISTATGEPGQPITVGPSPQDMAVTPDGGTVLVLTSTGLTPVDAATNRAGRPVAIQGASALAVAPGGTAYVLAMPDSDSQQGFVVPVHVRTGTTGRPIRVGLSPLPQSGRNGARDRSASGVRACGRCASWSGSTRPAAAASSDQSPYTATPTWPGRRAGSWKGCQCRRYRPAGSSSGVRCPGPWPRACSE